MVLKLIIGLILFLYGIIFLIAGIKLELGGFFAGINTFLIMGVCVALIGIDRFVGWTGVDESQLSTIFFGCFLIGGLATMILDNNRWIGSISNGMGFIALGLLFFSAGLGGISALSATAIALSNFVAEGAVLVLSPLFVVIILFFICFIF